jgi:HEAT repeat protein
MLRFPCDHCGHKLKATADLAGHRCKCTRCGRVLRVPSPAGPVARRLPVSRLALGAAAAGLLAAVALAVFLLYPRAIDRNLADLKGGSAAERRQALVWLAEADPDAAHRPQVTAALERLLVEGDVRDELKPALVLRVYLHWAGPENVPAMIRMVQTPALAHAGPQQIGLVMRALGTMQDLRAADALAEKLADPALGEQAADALRLLGPRAQPAVVGCAFDGPPAARLRATRLLDEFGARPADLAAEALRRLQSGSPDARRGAAAWFAENAPTDGPQQAVVARALAGLLQDLSPRVTAPALHALKLWATRDCLPQLVAFARRDEKAAPCPPELIDLLARFPDATAADAIALQLKSPANRGRAAQALRKLGGPVATAAVLGYIDSPKADVRESARKLCRELNVPADRLLNQTLADVADARKGRARTALESLARLRPDDASRPRVSLALNAALLDPDPAVAADALNAAAAWGTKANTATLLKLLARRRAAGATRDPRVLALLGTLQDPTAAPALAEGLTRPEELDVVVKALVALGPKAEDAVKPYLESTSRGARFAAAWVLGEVGTRKSLKALEHARDQFPDDEAYFRQTQVACEKVEARK